MKIKNKIKQLLCLGAGGLVLLTNLAAQEIRTRKGHSFRFIEAKEGVDFYEEIYEGVKPFKAKVKTDETVTLVENIVFSFPDCNSREWNRWGYKSIKVIFKDDSEASVLFKDIDKIDFFWNKRLNLDSLNIYLNNGKKASARRFYGSGAIDVMGKVYNEALEKYGDFKKMIYIISAIDFL